MKNCVITYYNDLHVHVAACPHSNKTHSMAASMQILHKSTVDNLSTAAKKKFN